MAYIRVFTYISLILSLIGEPCQSTRELFFDKTFYPYPNVQELRRFIKKQLDYSTRSYPLPPSVVLISPHAGYDYSGETAARAYGSVRHMRPELIVLLGPSHKTSTEISVYDEANKASWRNPIQRDYTMAVDPIAKTLALQLNNPTEDPQQIHATEHSLEVQMPFIASLFPNVPIVPILLNNPSAGDKLVKKLISLLKNKKVLYVISSDLSHYLPALQAEKKDRHTLKRVAGGSSKHFLDYLKNNTNIACGGAAIYAGLLLKEALSLPPVIWQQYAQSAPMGSHKDVVGYGSGVTAEHNLSIPEPLQKMLLKLARHTIRASLRKEPFPQMGKNYPRFGVFVTLKKKGELRGCVGSPESLYTLPQAVAYYALQAALHDGRFAPLTEKELNKSQIEISVLSPPMYVPSYKDVVPDQDGVILTKGFKRGVFLPTVWENMPRLTFFNELCHQKSDLPAHCYQDPDAQVETFQTFSFHE